MGRIDKAILEAGINTSQRIADSTQNDAELIPRPNETKPQAHMFAQSLAPETGAGLPGYLKQQDILRPLAPIMTSRGDTFTIRAYGETINPSTGKPDGQAWCEAVIQRIPDYLNKIDDPWKSRADENFNEINKKKFDNQNFFLIYGENEGLKNEIIHFGYCDNHWDYAKWLCSADILPVTNNQDFFGASIVEAIYCGAFPLLPNRLSYPELLPTEFHKMHLYGDEKELDMMIENSLKNINKIRNISLAQYFKRFDWKSMAPTYDQLFSSIIEKKHS